MKILIATGIFPPEIGGPATYAALLADELKKKGDEVIVLPFREVKHLPRVLRHFAYFVKVIRASSGADIVFTQDPVSTGIPVICAGFFTRKKVVMRVAGDYAWEQSVQQCGVKETIDKFQAAKYSGRVEFLRSLQKFAVRHADVVITPSNYFSRLVSSWLNNEREVKTIYNGIDLTVEFRKEAKFSEKTIISAGRLVPWKGFDTLIRAIKEMPGWKLLIAGDGPDKGRLELLVAECGIEGRVTFLGQLPRPELFAQIYRSHVFALLATFESFSFQTVEALHIGTPVVAADIGNLSEIIETGKSGILIAPTDISRFKEEAEKIATDSSYSSNLSLEGQKRAADFSIQKTFDQLHKVFEEVINHGKN
ncbi:MAG: glycosyltransferase family 4 protein [Patescibacteria group bacterium]